MRLTTFIPLLLVASAHAAPRPQILDFSIIDSIEVPAATVPIGPTAQIVTYDPTSAAAAAAAAVTAAGTELPKATVTAENTKRDILQARSACEAQQATIYTGATPADSTGEFLSFQPFADAANSAFTPNGYNQEFVNLSGSSQALGYLGYSTLSTYDTEECAANCNEISGCLSFNLYFERDPSIEPGVGCTNPSSIVNIKCVYWGGPLSADTATNVGQWRSDFHVVIAGSNGYTSTVLDTPSGYTAPAELGNAAINAPSDCNGLNTYLGYISFVGLPFDSNLCAVSCSAVSAHNIAHPPATGKPKTCQFFNTYILYKNGIAQAQVCSLYSESWSASYGTNTGQTASDGVYTIGYSLIFSNSENPTYASSCVTSSSSASAPVSSTAPSSATSSSTTSSSNASSSAMISSTTSSSTASSSTISSSTTSSSSTSSSTQLSSPVLSSTASSLSISSSTTSSSTTSSSTTSACPSNTALPSGELVINGGFEDKDTSTCTQTTSPWVFGGATYFNTQDSSYKAANGIHYVTVPGTLNNPGSIKQSLTLPSSASSSYNVFWAYRQTAFWDNSAKSGACQLLITLGGQQVFTEASYNNRAYPSFTYELTSSPVVLSSFLAVDLVFTVSCTGGASSVYDFDAISVTAVTSNSSCSSSSNAALASGQLIVNPSFENKDSACTQTNFPWVSSGQFYGNQNWATAGGSAYVTVNTIPNTSYSFKQTIPIAGSKSYNLSFYYRNTGFYNPSGSGSCLATVYVAGVLAWTQSSNKSTYSGSTTMKNVAVVVAVPASYSSSDIVVTVACTGGSSNTYDFDLFTLVPK